MSKMYCIFFILPDSQMDYYLKVIRKHIPVDVFNFYSLPCFSFYCKICFIFSYFEFLLFLFENYCYGWRRKVLFQSPDKTVLSVRMEKRMEKNLLYVLKRQTYTQISDQPVMHVVD